MYYICNVLHKYIYYTLAPKRYVTYVTTLIHNVTYIVQQLSYNLKTYVTRVNLGYGRHLHAKQCNTLHA